MPTSAIKTIADHLVATARAAGIHVPITTVPRQPLAMGNYDMLVDVRPAHPNSSAAVILQASGTQNLLQAERVEAMRCHAVDYVRSDEDEPGKFAAELIALVAEAAENAPASVLSDLADDIATDVVQMVCDMDDRSSPEDRPEMMLVTGPELRTFVLTALGNASARFTQLNAEIAKGA